MRVEDNRAHNLSQMVFLKKFLIPDYRGLGVVSKKVFFGFFGLFSTTTLKILLIFCKTVENNRDHGLSQMVFLKKSQSRIIGD